MDWTGGVEHRKVGEPKQLHVVSSQMAASNWPIHRHHSLPQLEAYSWDSRIASPKHFSTFSRFCVPAPDTDLEEALDFSGQTLTVQLS
jgi:hypothetical protein